MDDDGLDALYPAVTNQARNDPARRLLHGVGHLLVGAVIPHGGAVDAAQAVVGVEVGPRLAPRVILGCVAAASGDGEAEHGAVEAVGDGRGRGMQLGELGGEGLAGAGGGAGCEVEKVGREEVLAGRGGHGPVGVGLGAQVGDDAVDGVERGVLAWDTVSDVDGKRSVRVAHLGT